ncbi:GNAT family N-acetyltransferase [Streptomyces sp. NBC_01433]|uniref:GNAT family N-acetyltransferase n=1 Tax=Streptomyces sp. NBC_01433 TaxID=2903864 RepID=UPI002253EA35|nr:GNAT family N-acetyltransferase [Streptomyces sp. NBC_01433]MCX4681571.1 GNAT family N-acetyltransferase [Streptomyces sp. NBC_01433]
MSQLLPIAAQAWTVSAVPYDCPAARALTQALQREQFSTYGRADDPGANDTAEFEPPSGVFLVAGRTDGTGVGCGGWRTAGPATAEVKRMYVAPDARGWGLGRRLLQALERDARQHGMTKVILETGVRNHAALALYARCGYTLVESYVRGRDPQINRAMSKALSLPSQAHQQDGEVALRLNPFEPTASDTRAE